MAAARPITAPVDGRSQKKRYGTALAAHHDGGLDKNFTAFSPRLDGGDVATTEPWSGVPRVCSPGNVSREQASRRVSIMSVGDGQFRKGQPVWVIGPGGSQRAADFVGEGELSAWFGGSPTVIVVYLDTRSGEAVEVDRVIPRDA
jgi:hypothetical protein